MAATVKELAAEILMLRQELNNVRLTEDSHWAQYQADLLSLRNELKVYFDTKPATEAPKAPTPVTRTEPWRLPLESFKGFEAQTKANWEEGGNAKTGQKLARVLKRSSGHAEGQLYINWCTRVGRPAVKEFWLSKGCSEIPDGL